MPSADLPSPRVPWRAAFLSAVVTGLGQLYSGRPFRAILLHLLSGGITLTFSTRQRAAFDGTGSARFSTSFCLEGWVTTPALPRHPS